MIAQAVMDYGGSVEDYREQSVDAAAYSSLRQASDRAAMTLAQAKAAKTIEIREAAERFLAPSGMEYGPTERETWATQEAEARALLADPPQLTEAQAVNLAALVAGRSVAGGDVLTVTEQAQRIVANADSWRALAIHVTGQRNGYQDQVDAIVVDPEGDYPTVAEAVAAVLAIAPVFSLPGD